MTRMTISAAAGAFADLIESSGGRVEAPDVQTGAAALRANRGSPADGCRRAGGDRAGKGPRFLLRLLSPLLLIALAGCMVGSDYQTPRLSLPARWSGMSAKTAPQPPALSHWWTGFGDSTLDDLVAEAVAGNLDVAAAKARIRAARASLREAGAALGPSATGSGAAKRGGSGDGDGYSTFEAGFDASWELDLFGANRRNEEAARYGLDASAEDLRATLLTLVGDVAAVYVEARGYQARIALARRTAASQRHTAELTRIKFDAGSVSALDLAKAEGLAASTEADVATLEADFAVDVHRLAVLTGRAPGELDARMGKAAPIPRPRLPIASGIPADVLANRPDVRLAERELAQATAKVGAAEAARYPSVSLTGNISTSGSRLGDLGKTSSISWVFGPTLTVPIFNGGELAAAAESAAASRDAYFVAYRSAVLGALEDVENALVSLSRERARKANLDVAAVSYRRAAALARSLYQSGGSSFLDVLDAERSLYSAETAALESTVALATDYVSLNKALGGGWDGAVDAGRAGDGETSAETRPAVARRDRDPDRRAGGHPPPGGGAAAPPPPDHAPKPEAPK